MAGKKSSKPVPAGVGEAQGKAKAKTFPRPCAPGSFMKKEQQEVELDDKV